MKAYLFDFDGTLYSGENIYCKIHEHINKYKRSFLSNLTDEEYEKIVQENPSWQDAFSGANIAEHIYAFIKKYPKLNIKINDYRKWLLNVIEPVEIDKKQVVNTKFLQKLCEDFGEVFIKECITGLDEYVQSNDNKNKYKDFNLTLRKAIRDGWNFIPKSNKPSTNKNMQEKIEKNQKLGVMVLGDE